MSSKWFTVLATDVKIIGSIRHLVHVFLYSSCQTEHSNPGHYSSTYSVLWLFHRLPDSVLLLCDAMAAQHGSYVDPLNVMQCVLTEQWDWVLQKGLHCDILYCNSAGRTQVVRGLEVLMSVQAGPIASLAFWWFLGALLPSDRPIHWRRSTSADRQAFAFDWF